MIKTPTISFTSKKLDSGNLQIKFFLQKDHQSKYGYLLLTGSPSEEEIMNEIKKRLDLRKRSKMDLLRFSFKQHWKDDYQFFLYSS
ncbi:MAG: hypothetical protein WD431_20185 [Cyclobacteriaceae bacterium]